MPPRVGPGILAKMQANSDRPITHGVFKTDDNDGSVSEEAWGEKGFYIASNASGEWRIGGPFGGGED